MTEVLMWHSKKPRSCDLRGFSIPFWVGGLIPRLATRRFTPFLYLSGGGSVVHYITGAEMPQEAISPCLLSEP